MLKNILNSLVKCARSVSSWPTRCVRNILEYRFLRSLGFGRRQAWRQRYYRHEYLRNRKPIPAGLAALDL